MIKKLSSINMGSRLKFWILGVSILVLLMGAAVVIKIKHDASTRTSNSSQASNSTKNETPANTDSRGSTGKDTTDKGSTPDATYTPPTGNNGITITPSTSGDKVVVSTQLVGYSDGTCKLTATNGAKTNSQTADIIYAPSYSSCAGFVIPVDGLGTGTWELSLDVTSGGTTNTKTTTYEVR